MGWRAGTPKWGRRGWEPWNWVNSADPGDWEINHVLKRLKKKKTGSLLVRFPFSFRARRKDLLVEMGGHGMSSGCVLLSGAQFPVHPPCLPKCPNPKGLEGYKILRDDLFFFFFNLYFLEIILEKFS